MAIHEFAQPEGINELVVATHGRSIWIVDNTALRQTSEEVLAGTASKLYKPSNVVRWSTDGTRSSFEYLMMISG